MDNRQTHLGHFTLPTSNVSRQEAYFKALAQQEDQLRKAHQLKHLLRFAIEIIDSHAGELKSAEFPAEAALIAEARRIIGKSAELPNLGILRTDNQRNVLEFIRQYKAQHGGTAPTNRLIGQHIDASTSVVANVLRVLEEMGFICCVRDENGRARSGGIQLVGESYAAPILSS